MKMVGKHWESLSVPERYLSAVGGAPAATSVGLLAPLRKRLIATDAVMIVVSVAIGLIVSSRSSGWEIDPLLAIYGVPVVIAAMWLALLGLRGSYDQRFIGLGTEEIRRVVSATLYTFAIVAGISYLIRADISRAYAFVSLPLGLILIVATRFGWRGWLYRKRAQGAMQYRTVIVGSGAAHEDLVQRLTKSAYAGYHVSGSWAAPQSDDLEVWLDGLDELISATGSEAVALTPSETITGETVRRIAWRMEGRKIDILIAPAMLDVAGPRLSVRPAAGLPLIHLDEVALSKPQRFAKRALDLTLSVTLMIGLSPVMVACSLAVRLSSRGPVLFQQTRIGRSGAPFTMLKFRTMAQGADAQRNQLRAAHNLDEPMFKLAYDPRITRVGRFLRRWSLDELPQLFNVIGGSMSLVGPRPHPIDDVDRYERDAYRRLALKPGMTGLWQVEGRNEVPWQEALQLDLYYVESWSMSTDVVLLARTCRAVVQGRGAH